MAISMAEAISRFAAMAIHAELARHEALEKAAEIVEKEAKGMLGHEQPGWPALAEYTVADRVQHGYAPDEPELRDGELRDSIGHKVEGHTAVVGSTSRIAVYQELGTSRMPPRSFLEAAAHRKADEVAHHMGREVVAAMVGKPV